jgi:hypothetical protein
MDPLEQLDGVLAEARIYERMVEIAYEVLEYKRHVWLECLKESLGDPEFAEARIYERMVDGVLGFQSAIDHLD